MKSWFYLPYFPFSTSSLLYLYLCASSISLYAAGITGLFFDWKAIGICLWQLLLVPH